MSEPKLNIKEESSTKNDPFSPGKKAKVEQTVPKNEKAENRCR